MCGFRRRFLDVALLLLCWHVKGVASVCLCRQEQPALVPDLRGKRVVCIVLLLRCGPHSCHWCKLVDRVNAAFCTLDRLAGERGTADQRFGELVDMLCVFMLLRCCILAVTC